MRDIQPADATVTPAASTPQRRRLSTLALFGAGCALTTLYLVATVRLPLPRYFPGPGVSIGFPQMLGPDWREAAAQYAGFVTLAFALYAIALVAAVRAPAGLPADVVYGLPVLFVAALALMYPPTAVDLFHNQADARTLWVHGANPLIVPPSAHDYPIGISWANQPSPYGPIWNLLTVVPARLAGDHYVAGLALLKLLSGAFLLGSAALVGRIVGRLAPASAAVAVVAFAWNPFVVVRTVGDGHNDMVMIFFALLALERAQVRSWTWALPALALSVLVKYATALLVPMLVWHALAQSPGGIGARLRAVLPGAALAGAVTAAAYAPFWAGAATFATALGEADGKMITSTPFLLRALLEGVQDPVAAGATARWAARGAFLPLYLALLWQARRDFPTLVACAFTALFLYLVIAAPWFRPWYMLWPLALAALLPRTWFTAMLLALSFAASWPDLVEHYRIQWDWVAAGYWRLLAAPVAACFALPLLVWAAGLWRHETWTFNAGRRFARPAGTRKSAP